MRRGELMQKGPFVIFTLNEIRYRSSRKVIDVRVFALSVGILKYSLPEPDTRVEYGGRFGIDKK